MCILRCRRPPASADAARSGWKSIALICGPLTSKLAKAFLTLPLKKQYCRLWRRLAVWGWHEEHCGMRARRVTSHPTRSVLSRSISTDVNMRARGEKQTRSKPKHDNQTSGALGKDSCACGAYHQGF